MTHRLLFLFLSLLVAPVVARAQEMIEIRNGAPVTIRPDRAYILFRTDRPPGVPAVEPIFLRVPTAEDVEAYYAARLEAFRQAEPRLRQRREEQIRRNRHPVDPEPSPENFVFFSANLQNVHYVDAGRSYVRGRPESVYLFEARPGDYVLYGATYGGPGFTACFCLGTVGFTASAGVVTDLGYFLGDLVHRVSVIPELRAESGFGPSVNGYMVLLGGTVRPASAGLSVPEPLRGLTIRPAEYRAVGKFVEHAATQVNRLAPVAGVLAYERGRVIDVRSGREVPDVPTDPGS